MSQFKFDLDYSDTQSPRDVVGCIRAYNLYSVSSRDSSIQVVFENLNEGSMVRLDVADHPAGWKIIGEVAVSLMLTPDPLGLGYIGSNVKILNDYSSFEHLPYKYIPVRDVLEKTQEWIDSCPYESLKIFMYRVLGNPSNGCLFFSIPASNHRHFSEPAGLAKHSLEVAQMVYSSTLCFDEHERWLAAVAGLLHEVGRVRMNTVDSAPKITAGLVSCEALNFEVLSPALQMLEKEWHDGAEAIRHMLDSLYRVRKNAPHLPIVFSIRSADLMSIANNQRHLAFHDKPESERFARLGNTAAEVFWQPSKP